MNIVPKDVQRIIGFYVWTDAVKYINYELKSYTCKLLDDIDFFFTYTTAGCDQCHIYKTKKPDDYCDVCSNRIQCPREEDYTNYIFGWCRKCIGYRYLFSGGRCQNTWDYSHAEESPEIPRHCSGCSNIIDRRECMYTDPLLYEYEVDALAREYYMEYDK